MEVKKNRIAKSDEAAGSENGSWQHSYRTADGGTSSHKEIVVLELTECLNSVEAIPVRCCRPRAVFRRGLVWIERYLNLQNLLRRATVL